MPSLATASPVIPGGYAGLAYAVPAQGLNSVSGTILKANGIITPAEIPAGQQFRVEPIAGTTYMVAVFTPLGRIRTLRTNMWKIPDWVELQHMTFNINGVQKLLGDTSIRYLNYRTGEEKRFDDAATPAFDGIDATNRSFLSCTTNQWSLGGQKFATDVIIAGVHRRNTALIDLGIAALNWGIAKQTTAGNYKLGRTCSGVVQAPIEGNGGTHEASQYIEATGRAVWVLAASQYAGKYRTTIDRYRKSVELGSTYLTTKSVWGYWMTHWIPTFTHKRYIMSSALNTAAALTDNTTKGATFVYIGDLIARNGFALQWKTADHGAALDGVNPERLGYDVFYHGWGVRLGATTYSMLDPRSTTAVSMTNMVNRGFAWMNTRTNQTTGAVDITGSTRTCKEKSLNGPVKGYDPYPMVEALLYWGMKFQRPELITRAMLMSKAQALRLNPCPT